MLLRKRFLVYALVLCFVFLAASCGNSENKATTDVQSPSPGGEATESEATADIKVDVNLPSSMQWVAYEVGTTGYSQAAGLANALTQSTGTQIRVVPNDTSVGRISIMKNQQAKYGLLSDELYFASHGLYDFSAKNFGPQDLRVMLCKPTSFAFAVTEASGIKTIEDLKGKRINQVPGNTSHIIKTEAFLAFGGLTWDDVEIVNMASWDASARGLIEGKVDAVASAPAASTLYEVDASPSGLAFIEMPASNVEGWKRLQEITPWLAPGIETQGAGMDGNTEYEFPVYTYPQIACYADADEEEVYNLTKALVESFKLYENMDSTAFRWEVSQSSNVPNGAPYHEGAIRYFKEIGKWDDEKEAWNNEAIERSRASQEAWEIVLKEAEEQKISDADFPEFWNKRRVEILGR